MIGRRAEQRARFAAVFDEIRLDVRAALRALTRAPGFAIAAVVTLTVALALNVSVVAVAQAVLLRGFPLVENDGRLLYIQERYPDGACCITFADFLDWQAQAASFEGLAFVDGRETTHDDAPSGSRVDISVAAITANGFGVLGLRPAMGRDFAAADEIAGAPTVVILSHRFWQARFAARPDIVGRRIALDGVPATVVGVMPEGFDFPARHSLWLPLTRTRELEQRTPNGFLAFGRLARARER